MESIVLKLLLIVISIFAVFGTNPGIVVRVNNQGLEYGELIICEVNKCFATTLVDARIHAPCRHNKLV